MQRLTRRTFLTWASSALPLSVLARRAHALAVDSLTRELAPANTLRALGATVLPSELGDAGIKRAVDAFQEWIAGYREHAELTHGYGTSRLRFTAPTPATRWASQLDALDTAAKARYGQSFAALSRTRADLLVRDALANEQLDRMPSTADATHVAVALLAFYYDRPEATDLCYRSRIGRLICRPLAEVTAPPATYDLRPATQKRPQGVKSAPAHLRRAPASAGTRAGRRS